MSTKTHGATVSLSAVEVKKILRSWGWHPTGEGRNHVKWTKNGKTISIRNSGKSAVTYEPLREAAKLEGLSFDEWKDGPPPDVTAEIPSLSESDMEFFLDANFVELKFEEDKQRYRRIRKVLDQQGLLDRYNEIRGVRRREREQRQRAEERKKAAEIKQIKPDTEGYISLDEALAMRGAKQNKITETACQVIAALATDGEIQDADGRATRILLDKLPAAHRKNKPLGMTGLSGQLKNWDEAGLIWRQVKGKRVFKIGLCMPVKLTGKEQRRYLLNPPTGAPIRSADEHQSEPIGHDGIGLPDQDQALPAAPSQPTPAQTPERTPVAADGDPAIAVLQSELVNARSELDFYKGRVAGLERAIDILQKAQPQ